MYIGLGGVRQLPAFTQRLFPEAINVAYMMK